MYNANIDEVNGFRVCDPRSNYSDYSWNINKIHIFALYLTRTQKGAGLNIPFFEQSNSQLDFIIIINRKCNDFEFFFEKIIITTIVK